MTKAEDRPDVLAEQERIGRRIDEFRKRQGLTQAELAQRSGMSLDGVSRILLGHRAPHLGSLMAISKVLDVDYRDLLADADRADRRRSSRPSVDAFVDFLENESEAVVVAAGKCARAVAEALRERKL